MIVIDYLQLMSGIFQQEAAKPTACRKYRKYTRGLKATGQRAECARSLPCRSSAVRLKSATIKSRQLADLRESGSIEQDADMVMFIYREEYYLKRAEPGRHAGESDDKYNERYCTVAGNVLKRYTTPPKSSSPSSAMARWARCKLFFDGQFTRFTDLEENRKFDDE
jgi:replicative DNA helicase